MRQRSVICHTLPTSCSCCSSSPHSSATNMSRSSGDDQCHRYFSGHSAAPSSSTSSSSSSSSSSFPISTLNYTLPSTSLHSIYNRQQPVLKSLFDSSRRVTSLLLVTLLIINVARVSDAKPYASKRLSFGESMDWSFGGWTPLSESSAKVDFASFPLHEGRSSGAHFALAQPLTHTSSDNTQVPSTTIPTATGEEGNQSTGKSSSSASSSHNSSSATSSSSSITNTGTLDSSSSSQSYRVVEFMNQPPQPYLGLNSNSGEQLSQIAAGALYHLQQQQQQQQQQSAAYYPGLPPQPYTRQAENSNPSYQVVPQVPVPKIKVAVEPKPLREARIEAYKVIEHLEANADRVLNSPKVNQINENAPIYKGQLDENYYQQPQRQQQQQSYYEMNPYPQQQQQQQQQYQQQQQPQYEIQTEQQQRGPAYEIQQQQQQQPQQYKSHRQIPRYSIQRPSYERQQNQYQQQQQQQHEQQQPLLYHSGQMQYKQAVNLYDNNQITDGAGEYDNKLNGNGKSKTIVLPVKEVGKDYVTVPVAVETDSDQVLTPEDIKEIEHAVLKAIPETIGNYADKIPDHLYETALPINEVSKGEAFKTIELPPVIIPAGEGGGHYGAGNNNGGNNNGGGWSSYMPPMTNFMPNFISAISPSKGKISDLLRPLLSLVRPIHASSPLPPASPAQRVKGIADVPIIPGNAPYAGSHRPENLDVIHIIANHKSGSEPSVYHVNQLAPSPSLSMTRGQHGNELNYRS